ncbi:hypothetical protein CBM2595_A10016 [Cupriavidus taiwanensis]|nr:hypothetical protein CBM2595_A10016 [Cupriavidus taiwanensis]
MTVPAPGTQDDPPARLCKDSFPSFPLQTWSLQYEPPHDARYGRRQCAGLGQAPQADCLGRGNRRADQARQHLLVRRLAGRI